MKVMQQKQGQWLQEHVAPEELHTAVIWLKAASSVRPDIWAVELPQNPWILQPFERWEQRRPEDLRSLG